MDLKNKQILVTGGAGFLGTHVLEALRNYGANQVVAPRSKQYDLRSQVAITQMLKDHCPDVIIHLAATVGGIGFNEENPGRLFYDNAVMGIELMEQARVQKVEKFVTIGTVCAYPKFAKVPFKESELWNGYPEETNAPYGLAKIMLLAQSQAYREQYNFNSVYLLPVNLYGPRDNFDLKSSHIIPALIRKCLEAKMNNSDHIVLWGDGSATREFLYATDAARAIVAATQAYESPLPVNIGSGYEISIKNLAKLVCKQVGFEGEVRWDTNRPNGQPRRCLDTTRAQNSFGFTAQVTLEEGIRHTIEWYKQSFLSPTSTLNPQTKVDNLTQS